MKKKIFVVVLYFIEKCLFIKYIFVFCEEGFLIIFVEYVDNIVEEVEKIIEEMIFFFFGYFDLLDFQIVGDL